MEELDAAPLGRTGLTLAATVRGEEEGSGKGGPKACHGRSWRNDRDVRLRLSLACPVEAHPR
jgi:hypothetical protein